MQFFKLRTDYGHRGHKYKLFLLGCKSNTRHNFFNYRSGRMWNNLPADNTDFSNLNSFKLLHSWLVIAKFIFSSTPIVVLCYQ